MSPDLLRQRRNIIAISCILIFAKYSKIEIAKFSILGIQFSSFDNPEAIFLALWVIWVYFSIRYYQYFIQEGFPKFKDSYSQILNADSIKKIDSIVLDFEPNCTRLGVPYSTLKAWEWIYSGQIQKDDGLGGFACENFKLPISKRQLYGTIIKSFLKVCINRSSFTDYIFPVVLAFVTFVYCFVGWQGSLKAVFLDLFI